MSISGTDKITLPNNLLPLTNLLSKYGTVNYFLTFSAISKDMVNDPDGTYMQGMETQIICKSAGADPNNRVQTFLGKYDFYIDNLELHSMIGFRKGKNSNVNLITFEVYEPYSIGGFLAACQQAALEQGFKNMNVAPFLLKIEFKGNKEFGMMETVPYSTKYLPIMINSVSVSANESGSKYTVKANVLSSYAQTVIFTKLTRDITISGKTVQEILQSLETSLQSNLNAIKKDEAKLAESEPDKVLILFPSKITSGLSSTTNLRNRPTMQSNASQAASSASVFKKLGTSTVNVNGFENEVQQSGINDIGTASMSFNNERLADTTATLYSKVYKDNKMKRSAVVVDENTCSFTFPQGTDVSSIINEVILNSAYAEKALQEDNVDEYGNRIWWRIDSQVYYIGGNNEATTNKPTNLIVFRVVPYVVHTSRLMAPGVRPKGINALRNQVAKRYNYIYTGQNSEVISFDINFNHGFLTAFQTDKGSRGKDEKLQDNRSKADSKSEAVKGYEPTKTPSKSFYNVGSPVVTFTSTSYSNQKDGGSNAEDASVKVAKQFQAAITNSLDMVMLNMKILGDPFWITSSGMGNHCVSKTNYINVNSDYSVNWETGEVYIDVIFKSPLDINQFTGLYNFGGPFSDPTIGFRGLYRVNTITSFFKNGEFTQEVQGMRINNQDIDEQKEATNKQVFNSTLLDTNRNTLNVVDQNSKFA
jgi:hypothetical protein